MELIETLTKELGVRQEQAKNGVGLLFQLVKQTLGEEDFCKAARLVPGLQEMVNPGCSSTAHGATPIMDSSPVSSWVIGHQEALAGELLRLGLDDGMMTKFIPFMVSYVRHEGGAAINNLSEKDLS